MPSVHRACLVMAAVLRPASALMLPNKPPALHRRPFVCGGLLAALPAPALAGDFTFDPTGSWIRESPDGSWTNHDGPFDETFFSEFKANNGFLYKFIQDGEGDKPVKGQQVLVHYTGYLLNGKRFDSSYDRGSAFKFTLGGGKVISGWEAIVAGMNKGKRVVVKIPAQFAYGSKGNGPIPPDADLLFYMELYRLYPMSDKD